MYVPIHRWMTDPPPPTPYPTNNKNRATVRPRAAGALAQGGAGHGIAAPAALLALAPAARPLRGGAHTVRCLLVCVCVYVFLCVIDPINQPPPTPLTPTRQPTNQLTSHPHPAATQQPTTHPTPPHNQKRASGTSRTFWATRGRAPCSRTSRPRAGPTSCPRGRRWVG